MYAIGEAEPDWEFVSPKNVPLNVSRNMICASILPQPPSQMRAPMANVAPIPLRSDDPGFELFGGGV